VEFSRAVEFLRQVEIKQKTEARLDLFYNPSKDRFDWVPPTQKVSASSISYQRNEIQAEILNSGFLLVGSMHSHPNGLSAFASGVDASDEFSNDGVHFTVAKLLPGQGSLEIDCRLVLRGVQFPRSYTEFVECDFRGTFPDWWLQLVQKEEWNVRGH
jgi:hypothetical protein